MTTISSASAAVTEGAKVVTPRWKMNGRIGKLRVMCRYGGNVVSLPGTKSPRYVGGDTRIVAVPPSVETSFASLVSHLKVTLGFSYDFKVKYQLPDQELDSLISVETDEDVEIMMEEHGYLSPSDSSIPHSRIRLFLFPWKPQVNDGGKKNEDPSQCKAVTDIDLLGLTRCELTQPVLEHANTDTGFVDAFKGVEMMQSGSTDSGEGDGNGGICGQESMNLETNSSFGSSSSSSVSSSKLPSIKTTGEDKMANSQVKFAPIESVASFSSDDTVVTPLSPQVTISPHEQMARLHVLENRVSSNLYDAELHKPVPVSVYPPFLNQAPQQQHSQVIYTGNPPMTLPATTYHHTNHIHYQLPPQPYQYPIYYIPFEQYSSRHIPSPPVKRDTVFNTHQVGSPVVRTSSSPFAHGLASQFNFSLLPLPIDSSVQTSSETLSTSCHDAFIFNTNLDDDTARAQIYKSQPPAPIAPSQCQTGMLTEALGQLRTHNA